ncbi:hypothetical protein IEO21_10636 [Rhodonia placenta]|uniref:Uncharacterized protein n=1 Tax=Rhodonia placenta TaxID=104341 RepID=A0A8H7NS53_9APHY|nr:hypothetical protein IEO21_10636 [Postia placenta]
MLSYIHEGKPPRDR